MTWIQMLAFALVGVGATCVVLTRDPRAQLLVYGFYGALLGVLFFTLGAADVALSEIVIGSAALPLLVLLALAKVRKTAQEKEKTRR